MLIAIAIPTFTGQLEKSRDATSAANIRSAYALAQSSYLTETSGGNADVTVNKTGNKVTSVVIANVAFEGQQAGWSGAIANLPSGVDWSALGGDTDGALGGQAGKKSLTFTYEDSGSITLSVA